MTERHSQKHPLLFALFLLLSTTAASPQLVDGAMRINSRASLPQSCLRVLQRPVAGCTAVEFEARRGCSRACERGLLTTQAALQGACRGAASDLSTLVDAALDADLVGAVCGWVEDDDEYETSRPSTTMVTTTTRRVESSSTPGSSTPTPVVTSTTPPDDDNATRDTPPPQRTQEAGDGDGGTPADDGVDPFSVFRGGSAGRLGGGLGHAAAVVCGVLFLLVR